MEDKIDKLYRIYGTWGAVARKLHKTERQVQNYRNGHSRISYELNFLIDHLIMANQ